MTFASPLDPVPVPDRVPPSSAAQGVERLLVLDLPGALRAAHEARTEAARARAFLRAIATGCADPEALATRAAAILGDLEREG